MQVLMFQSYNILVGTLISVVKKKKDLSCPPARCDSMTGGSYESHPGSFLLLARTTHNPLPSQPPPLRGILRDLLSLGGLGTFKAGVALFSRRSFWVVGSPIF